MKKKLLALVSAFSMLLPLFWSCTSEENSELDIVITQPVTIQIQNAKGSFTTFTKIPGEKIKLTKDIIGETEKKGMTFLGWSTNKDATSASIKADSVYTCASTNSTLYCIYSPIVYTIKYYILDESNNPVLDNTLEPKTYTTDKGVTLAVPKSSSEDAVFNGWYSSETISGAKRTSIAKGAYGNKEFYGSWGGVLVIFNTTGGDPLPVKRTSENSTVKLPAATRNGYTFAGWATTQNGPKAYDKDNNLTVESDNITLYALWTANEYSITYKILNSETNQFEDYTEGAANTKKYSTGDESLNLAAPTTEGKTLSNWYTDDELKTPFVYTTSTYGNLTLYAKWAITTGATADIVPVSDITISVTANANGTDKDLTATEGMSNYTWYKDGVRIANATTNVLTVTAASQPESIICNYVVTCSDSKGNYYSAHAQVSF